MTKTGSQVVYPMMLHTEVCDEFDAYVADNRDLFDWVVVSNSIIDDMDMLAAGALPSEL